MLTLTLLWATIVAQNKPSAACCGGRDNLKKKMNFFLNFRLWCLSIHALKIAN